MTQSIQDGSIVFKATDPVSVYIFLQVSGKSTLVGLCIIFFAGVSLSFFSPAFNLATNDQWHTLKEGIPHLSVYTAFFYFSTSFFVLAFVINLILLYFPILNLPKTSFKGYLTDWNGRGLALLAGLLCGFGNGLEFMGGQAAGYAAADSVQVSVFILLTNMATWYWRVKLVFNFLIRSNKIKLNITNNIIMSLVFWYLYRFWLVVCWIWNDYCSRHFHLWARFGG